MSGLSSPVGPLKFFEPEIGATVLSQFESLGHIPAPVVCVLNGEPLLRKDWSYTISAGDDLKFIVLPQGGDLNKILAAVATIALAVVAPYASGVIAGYLGITSAVGTSLITAGLLIGGSLLINALLPPSSSGLPGNAAAASPTYSLDAQGNTARLLQPIPKLYGRHLLYPDFASMPFISYSGNDQYLYQLFSLGLGRYNVEEVRIEDTTLWTASGGFTDSFSNVEIEFIEPGDPVTLFPASVITSVEVSGQELLKFDDSRKVSIEDDVITISGSGDEKLQNIAVGDEITITGSLSDGTYEVVEVDGTGEWIRINEVLTTQANVTIDIETNSWLGPFVATAPDRSTDMLSADFVFGRGLYYASNNGSLANFSVTVETQARQIDNLGNPLSSWSTLGVHTYTLRTATAQRFTNDYSVTTGLYEVRFRRTSHKESSSRYGNEVSVGALRAFIPDDNTFPDVTLMAVKMKASNQLSDRSARRFNTIQTSIIPVWDGEEWADAATSSPAWAAADVLMNETYGAGMPESQIDIPALTSLAALWTTRGDEFNGVFDSKQSIWDVLSTILRVGRAQPLLIAGSVSFVRDQEVTLSRALLTPANIIRNSFEATYILYDEDTPDSVIVEFFDERTWKMNEVLCELEEGESEDPARIQLLGCTSRLQAWREGMYQAAANLYRRQIITLSVEMEGRMLIRGDAVKVSHDLPSWGGSAIVEDWNEASKTLTLSEPADGATVIVLSDRKGAMWGPVNISGVTSVLVTLDGDSYDSIVAAQGEIPVYTDHDEEPTRVAFGSSTSYAKQTKVIGTSPQSSNQVNLVLVVDDERVYEADLGEPPEELDPYGPGIIPGAPQVSNLIADLDPSSPADPVLVNISCDVSPGATEYIFQFSYDGIYWQNAYVGTQNNCQVQLLAGPIWIRGAAIGTLRGDWAEITPQPKTFGTALIVPGEVTDVVAEADTAAGTLAINWTAAPRATSYRVDVYSKDEITEELDVLEITRTTSGNFTLITSTTVINAGGPWQDVRVVVTPINAQGEGVPGEDTLLGIDLGFAIPTGVTAVQATVSGQRVIKVEWTSVSQNTQVRFRLEGDDYIIVTASPNSQVHLLTGLVDGDYEVGIKHISNTGLESQWLPDPPVAVTFAVDPVAPSEPVINSIALNGSDNAVLNVTQPNSPNAKTIRLWRAARNYFSEAEELGAVFAGPSVTVNVIDNPTPNGSDWYWVTCANESGIQSNEVPADLITKGSGNLLTNSHQFNLWSKTIASITTGEDGWLSGVGESTRLEPSANGQYLLLTFPATAALSYTASFIVKEDQITDGVTIYFGGAAFSSVTRGSAFSLSTGTSSDFSGGVDSDGMEDLGDGWWRIWITEPADATGSGTIVFRLYSGAPAPGDGLILDHAQVEQASSPSGIFWRTEP